MAQWGTQSGASWAMQDPVDTLTGCAVSSQNGEPESHQTFGSLLQLTEDQ